MSGSNISVLNKLLTNNTFKIELYLQNLLHFPAILHATLNHAALDLLTSYWTKRSIYDLLYKLAGRRSPNMNFINFIIICNSI